MIKATEEDYKLLAEVDMEDDEQITTSKQINIEDAGVKDRWSRYIGAMGIDAVAKQSNAKILIFGIGALGAEISKNLVLAGCKELTLWDTVKASYKDLSGNFFLDEKAIGMNRSEYCRKKVQQLNHYVKVTQISESLSNQDSIENANLKDYDVVILTEACLDTQKIVNDYWRQNDTKFISADVNGVFCRIFNDFGDEFEVIDKDGEEIKEVVIQDITNEEQGVVTLLHSEFIFEDGDEVQIQEVKGMTKTDESDKSINGSVHKIITVNPTSFKIGNTLEYSKYEGSGLAKQIKTKKVLNFKSLSSINWSNIPHDPNLMIADFEKMNHNNWSHFCYDIIDNIKKTSKYFTIKSWHSGAFDEFINIFESKMEESLTEEQAKELMNNKNFEKFTASYWVVNNGIFNPLCAFIGGVVSQETVKAITNKFIPIQQFFYYDSIELIPDFRIDTKDNFEEDMNKLGYMIDKDDRYAGLRASIGQNLIDKIHNANLFVIGAGAIGWELLKNYAMLGAGSKEGSILVTDPDIIEVSNLNRQFLFREKHLRKPKSVTAAAAAIHMNPEMKGKIIPKLDKIHKSTEGIYSQRLYKSLSMITNALDNVAARRYLDGQWVKAKTPMIDSGTLGPKGHVQVVLPNKTESYASTNDPEDINEIPHCTLKMFPEEVLHWVEWARDLFSRIFNQSAKSYNKIIGDEDIFDPNDSEQRKIVKDALALIEDRPTNFKEWVRWARIKFNEYFVNDIEQLLYAYPLDKMGKSFKQ